MLNDNYGPTLVDMISNNPSKVETGEHGNATGCFLGAQKTDLRGGSTVAADPGRCPARYLKELGILWRPKSLLVRSRTPASEWCLLRRPCLFLAFFLLWVLQSFSNPTAVTVSRN